MRRIVAIIQKVVIVLLGKKGVEKVPTRIADFAQDRISIEALAAERRDERTAAGGSRSDVSVAADWRDGKIIVIAHEDDITGELQSAGLFHRRGENLYYAISVYNKAASSPFVVMEQSKILVREFARGIDPRARIEVAYLEGSVWDTFWSRYRWIRREPFLLGEKPFVLFWTTAQEVLDNL